MTATTIDTLDFARKLRAGGVEEKAAETIAQVIKQGIESTPAPAEIAQIKSENADIKAENADAKTRLTKMGSDIGDIKIRLSKIEADVADLVAFKAEMRTEMRWQRWLTCAIIVLVVSDIILQNL